MQLAVIAMVLLSSLTDSPPDRTVSFFSN